MKNNILFEVIDSFGRPSGGQMAGNTRWFGEYDQCFTIKDQKVGNATTGVSTITARHCQFVWYENHPVSCYSNTHVLALYSAHVSLCLCLCVYV